MRYFVNFIFMLTGFASVGQSNTDLLTKEIKKIIRYDTYISLEDTKGFIIGIIDNDSTYIIPFQNNKTELSELHTTSLFEIGGLTKIFTAHLLTLLEQEGKLDLESPINKYLPEKYQNPELTITFLDLITHSAGMPKQPKGIGLNQSNPKNPYAGYSEVDALEFYTGLKLQDLKPSFQYSHYNYALLGAIITNWIQPDLNSLFEKYIFSPLNMQNSSLISSQALEIGFNTMDIVSTPWTYSAYQTSLGLKSNLKDLITYARFHLKVSETNQELATLLHQSNLQTNIDKSLYMGREWYIIKSRKKYPIYTHAGHTDGHKVFMGFVKETKTGVIILSRSKFEIEDLGLLTLRLMNDTWKRKKP